MKDKSSVKNMESGEKVAKLYDSAFVVDVSDKKIYTAKNSSYNIEEQV